MNVDRYKQGNFEKKKLDQEVFVSGKRSVSFNNDFNNHNEIPRVYFFRGKC